MLEKETLKEIFRAGVAAVDPYRRVSEALSLTGDLLTVHGRTYVLRSPGSVCVAGFGKASVKMARAAKDVLGNRVRDAVVLAPVPRETVVDGVRVLPADHPLCGANTLRSSETLLETLRAADRASLTILLVSGGGSAMFEQLPGEVPLSDYRKTIGLLLRSGADIGELNRVRTFLSLVKGGKLLPLVGSSRLHCLIVSDVIGDDPRVIASGPTCRTRVGSRQVGEILDQHRLRARIPGTVREYLRTARPSGSRSVVRVVNTVIASNRMALDAMAEKARESGYRPFILGTRLNGEARDAARSIAAAVRSVLDRGRPARPPCCLLCGGETTVTVRGKGRGGRNQELSLAFLLATAGLEGVSFLSAGTDGIDGFTNAAGAFVTNPVRRRMSRQKLDASRYLMNNDSNGFFRRAGGLFVTGPTGTNVMDVQIALVAGKGKKD
jgi:glycerate-2-kinase